MQGYANSGQLGAGGARRLDRTRAASPFPQLAGSQPLMARPGSQIDPRQLRAMQSDMAARKSDPSGRRLPEHQAANSARHSHVAALFDQTTLTETSSSGLSAREKTITAAAAAAAADAAMDDAAPSDEDHERYHHNNYTRTAHHADPDHLHHHHHHHHQALVADGPDDPEDLSDDAFDEMEAGLRKSPVHGQRGNFTGPFDPAQQLSYPSTTSGDPSLVNGHHFAQSAQPPVQVPMDRLVSRPVAHRTVSIARGAAPDHDVPAPPAYRRPHASASPERGLSAQLTSPRRRQPKTGAPRAAPLPTIASPDGVDKHYPATRNLGEHVGVRNSPKRQASMSQATGATSPPKLDLRPPARTASMPLLSPERQPRGRSPLARAVEAVEEDADLDYPCSKLHTMSYNDLAAEPFDYIPPSDPTPTPSTSTPQPLPDQLSALLHQPSPAQHTFFAALPASEWDQAGAWIASQIAALVQQQSTIRAAKRALAQDYEARVLARHEGIRDEAAVLERTMARLRQGGTELFDLSAPDSAIAKRSRRA